MLFVHHAGSSTHSGRQSMINPETTYERATSSGIQVGVAGSTIRRPWMTILLLALAGGLLAPIWTVRYPPLVDYPNHLATAFVLAHLKDPAFRFRDFYAADWNSYPYLTMDVFLVGLQHFVSIDLAGRLLLSLCVLSVPSAAWFFRPSSQPR